MSDYGELKSKAEAIRPNEWRTYEAYEEDRRYYDEEIRQIDFMALATPDAILSLIAENTSLKGSCKALGGRNLRALERANRVLERKNAKHVANRNEFVSCMERKGEEIDNLKADNKALLEALEAFVNDIVPSDVNDPLWVAGRAAIETARKTAAK